MTCIFRQSLLETNHSLVDMTSGRDSCVTTENRGSSNPASFSVSRISDANNSVFGV